MINIQFKPHYRVLHFTNEIGKYIIGGMASYMNEMYRHHGQDVGFVHFYNSSVQDIVMDSYPGPDNILAVAAHELDRLRELSFDIAVVHFYALHFMIDENVLKGRPLIYVVHSVPTTEPYFPEQPFGEQHVVKEQFESMCERANIIVTVSHAEAHKLIALYPEFESKVRVIHNGMTYTETEPAIQSIREHRKTFGFLGRLDYRKGLYECLRAFKTTDACLKIACGFEDPEYLSSILGYIEAADLQSKIEFLGWCQGERKLSFLRSLDALIVPSLYEPFGYVVLEAMSQQLPLICSNRGGIPEIVGDYKYCFDPYDSDSLAVTIHQFQTDDKEVIQEQVIKLYQRTKRFTSEEMSDKYEMLYHSIM
ncbi:D-inositol-3-phosphate glycosyltransferase [Paenibacillus plantiphilus]|uniref:D-inositol-3-phosphate glycosyltransferase n=1 Tax=Paenibacillus plantiphilus TaxID=2905650 RepID=A0ABM9BUN8_9BACL|nr:glycosyltransferase family 4 protein [Paenibacillus plantiphilus]CAH1193838.1 D-inositol-3-phosphate glycosyltransferase [Paenibacillus plantiphilus]